MDNKRLTRTVEGVYENVVLLRKAMDYVKAHPELYPEEFSEFILSALAYRAAHADFPWATSVNNHHEAWYRVSMEPRWANRSAKVTIGFTGIGDDTVVDSVIVQEVITEEKEGHLWPMSKS